MRVQFADEQLGWIETKRASETRLPYSVVAVARSRLTILRAAPDFDTLKRWRSFGLPDDAALPGRHTIGINEQWGMDVTFLENPELVSIVNAVEEQCMGRLRA